MKHWSLLGLAGLLLHATHALAQSTAHPRHEAHTPAPASTTPAPGRVAAPQKGARHPSAFAGYRPFNADEPLKDWRAANEEVRASGGHIGLMKAPATGSAAEDHASHGGAKKQP